MPELKITECGLPGVKIIEPTYFEDFRGYYCETYSLRTMSQYDINTIFVQDNHSFSKIKGTLRGIHFQNNPKSQTKLVRCINGVIMDYIVDLRIDSPTYKKWLSIEISAENRKQVFIPNGYGHAFISLTDNCEILYKVDNSYYPKYDRSILWNDPELAIKWCIDNPILSEKDQKAPSLKKSDINFTMELNN